ncbi:ABC transporter permease [Streptosporangium sp. NPDC051022]|uniref:ABC transporter permease n=1 Tax=Streptosporangium sp. NPDC051022 TaxID=3155752 RepID=UPI003444744F
MRPQMHRFGDFVRRNRALTVSVAVLGAMVVAVALLPLVLPSTRMIAPSNRLLPPSWSHPFGTDSYGRDVLSRLVTGGRYSLGLAALITLCAGTLGLLIGMVSGFFRTADAVLMRLVDAGMAFPGIVLAMSLAVALGPSMSTELLALTIVFTPLVARVIRSRALSVSRRNYIDAARAAGVPAWKILLKHVCPNVLPLAVVQLVIISAMSMLIDGALSFLGLGIAPPTPTWGNMISDGRDYLTVAPWLVIFPGVALLVCVFFLNLLGSSLRATVDPRVRALNALQRLRARHRTATPFTKAPRMRTP